MTAKTWRVSYRAWQHMQELKRKYCMIGTGLFPIHMQSSQRHQQTTT
jgi:hypothetical protein